MILWTLRDALATKRVGDITQKMWVLSRASFTGMGLTQSHRALQLDESHIWFNVLLLHFQIHYNFWTKNLTSSFCTKYTATPGPEFIINSTGVLAVWVSESWGLLSVVDSKYYKYFSTISSIGGVLSPLHEPGMALELALTNRMQSKWCSGTSVLRPKRAGNFYFLSHKSQLPHCTVYMLDYRTVRAMWWVVLEDEQPTWMFQPLLSPHWTHSSIARDQH